MKQNSIPNFLHLSCGRIYKKGFYNVDVDPQVKADKHFNFNKFPWPLPKNHFTFVEMHHVLEHLDNPTQVIEEEFTMTRTNMLWLNPMFNWLLNASPLFTELILCKILPVSQVIFTLKVIK